MRAFRRYLTEEEQARLLRHLHLLRANVLAKRDGALMRVLLYSGNRLGETLLMSVGDALAALKSGWVFIPKEHRKGWNRKPHTDKAGKSYIPKPPADHSVRVTEPLREALQDLLAVRVEMTGLEPARESDALIVSRQGWRITARMVQIRWKKWAADCNLPPEFSPHWLRHTRAKNIMRRSTSRNPLAVVQAALAHATVSSTGIYTEVDREELAAALEEVDGRGDGRRVKRGLRKAYEGRTAA